MYITNEQETKVDHHLTMHRQLLNDMHMALVMNPRHNSQLVLLVSEFRQKKTSIHLQKKKTTTKFDSISMPAHALIQLELL